jgi:hypothetical protein
MVEPKIGPEICLVEKAVPGSRCIRVTDMKNKRTCIHGLKTHHSLDAGYLFFKRVFTSVFPGKGICFNKIYLFRTGSSTEKEYPFRPA